MTGGTVQRASYILKGRYLMKRKWFEKFGWIYRPTSLMGWTITLITLSLCVWVFLAVDRRSHSVSDTLMDIFPYVALFLIIWGWVASKTSIFSNKDE
jgi:hypothetical protein